LAVIVATTLRIPVARVGPHDSFASLGMDSLASVELTAAIEDELEIELSLTAVHEFPDLASLCNHIERGADDSSARARRLAADATLARDITPGATRGVSTRDARNVLLTGATGFVGAYLLRELLDETPATVHCLVRKQAVPGAVRVQRNLSAYGLWSPDFAARIAIVDGDLTQPLLGLGSDRFNALASGIDAIYHAGADVNWVHAYETLRAANVDGTHELLRFACTGDAKPFHFLSSVSVCHSTTGARVVDEQTDVWAGVVGLRLGYAQSKCVAEALVRSAGERGLPVTITRPSLVSGDGVHGRSNIDDLTSRFIAGCIRMHAAPDLDWRMDCVPVDDVARAVVRLARAHESGIGVAHLTAVRPRHWRECVLWMRLCGYDIDLLPYREWTEVLRATEDETHPLHALRAFFLHTIAAESNLTLPELFEESRRSHVSATDTSCALDALGVSLRALNSDLLARYFDHFVECCVVPPAASRSSTPRSPSDDASDIVPTDRLAAALDDWLGSSVQVSAITLTPLASDESIVAELTAWRANTQAGLFRARVSITDRTGVARDVDLFVKAKAADAQSIEVAEALAALASPALGDTVARFRADLGLTHSHLRELALYRIDDRRLRDYMPHPVLVERDDSRKRWLLVLESIDDALLLNAIDSARWDNAAIDVALTGLASIHSVWYGRETSLAGEEWLSRPRVAAQRVAMTPLWAALAEHAIDRSLAWSDPRLRRLHERLVRDVSSWARTLDDAPRTLIHNDFNPRNVALRRTRDGARLCAYDWELATQGAPQRDLAEFLCFVLPPDASSVTIARWVERYRLHLADAVGVAVPRAQWEAGFSAALCDFLVDRLATYAMIDRVRPQRFLPRVARSWLSIFPQFPWVE
jgi:thioester reductase-like protein